MITTPIQNIAGKFISRLTGKIFVPTNSETPDNNSEPPGTDKTTKSSVVPIIGIVLLAVCLVAFIGLQKGNDEDAIPLLNMVTAENTGVLINGHGSLSAKITEDSALNILKPYLSSYYTIQQMRVIAAEIADTAIVSISQSQNLTNSDSVTITVTMNGGLVNYPDLTFTSGSAAYTISGLTDAIEIKPFDLINVSIEGNSGAATATLTINSSAKYIPFLNFSISPTKGLSNGDTVTVSIKPNTEKMLELGYTVSVDENDWIYQITVSGLSESIADVSTVSTSMINSMVAYAESDLAKNFNAITVSDSDIVEEPNITSIYFLDKVDQKNPYTNYFKKLEMTNAIFVLGKFSATQNMSREDANENGDVIQIADSNVLGGYYIYIFPNLVTDADGNISYSRSMITQWPTNFQTELDCLNWIKGEFIDFAITEIAHQE